MPDQSVAVSDEQVKRLVKEALVLSQELSSMDKKIESDIKRQRGALASWWKENVEDVPANNFVKDKLKDKLKDEALESAFKGLIKVLGISAKYVGKAAGRAGFVLDLLTPMDNDNVRVKYMDDHPKLMGDYYAKKDRLAQIYHELFRANPPSATSLVRLDDCRAHACMKSLP